MLVLSTSTVSTKNVLFGHFVVSLLKSTVKTSRSTVFPLFCLKITTEVFKWQEGRLEVYRRVPLHLLTGLCFVAFTVNRVMSGAVQAIVNILQ